MQIIANDFTPCSHTHTQTYIKQAKLPNREINRERRLEIPPHKFLIITLASLHSLDTHTKRQIQFKTYTSCSSGRSRSTISSNISFHFPSVEVSVAATGCTSKGAGSTSLRHVLPAPVNDVSADTGSMILLALYISHCPHGIG